MRALNTSSPRKIKLPLIVALITILLLTGIGVAFTVKHKSPDDINSPKSATPTTGGASSYNQKGETTSATTSSSSASDNSQPGDSKSNSGGASDAILIKPSGTFVSNHSPNLSGKPAPNTLSSVCTTTPGATCTIKFSKDGVTKSLPPQTTDRGGSAYWNNWSLGDYGLSVGTWKVEAVATLNGQSISASDSLPLEVAQ